MPLLDNTIVLYYFLINLTFKNVKTKKNKHFTRLVAYVACTAKSTRHSSTLCRCAAPRDKQKLKMISH